MCSAGWGSTAGSTQMQVPALAERGERKREQCHTVVSDTVRMGFFLTEKTFESLKIDFCREKSFRRFAVTQYTASASMESNP